MSLQILWPRFVLLGLVVAGTVTDSAASTLADTTLAASRRVVKAGARIGGATGRVAVPQLRYEWQLRPEWSLQVGSGYRRSYSNLGFYRRLRTTYWTTEVTANHYLGRSSAQPLSGWYAGFGLGTVHRTIRDRNSTTPMEEFRSQAWGIEPRIQLGGQATLSRRVALQVYAATTFPYYFERSNVDTTTNPWRLLALELGLSLGYRH
ncbi:hypothetical protein SAMN00120144_4132 [Hymenobacter roseosalivarius DSM 11622]|uniref:DUF3575 domain-containing protein n=1 Tax=Hymenobacter roseosalivarius DSM 11622 TaxID=645990 RepID=A0A1W1W4P3_9BACT|nr:hypothetical protein [Hymenobacter roseosalivarius]SMC00589.1 hypothetical protein SAMN00120144_4132 [Hymenobacter roseosalivarius DSM 11622]